MNYRAKLIRIVTFIGGLYFFLRFVIPPSVFPETLQTNRDDIENGLITIGSMALGLGLINVLGFHGSRIIFKRTGWVNSLALIVGMFAMLYAGFGDWSETLSVSKSANEAYVLRDYVADLAKRDALSQLSLDKLKESGEKLAVQVAAEAKLETNAAEPKRKNTALDLEQSANTLSDELKTLAVPKDLTAAKAQSVADALGKLGNSRRELGSLVSADKFISKLNRFLQDGLFVALGSAMFSLLAFYITAAAYRAFRIKSAESALMMTAALLVMLGQIPFSAYIWDGFPEVRLWILETPNAAAFRAIRIGASVAGLVLAVRMWLSIETESFAGKKK